MSKFSSSSKELLCINIKQFRIIHEEDNIEFGHKEMPISSWANQFGK